uniref:SFRICE_013302 n=1 Tax=Spodoptera frugiperda TaxID=7108 RepID=A0A2H1VH06_SPOFR
MSHYVFFAFLVADISALVVHENVAVNEEHANDYHIMEVSVNPANVKEIGIDPMYSYINEEPLKCTAARVS